MRRLPARRRRPTRRRILLMRERHWRLVLRTTADNATLSYYSAKDGKISISYQGWDQSKTVLAGQTVCLAARIIDAHPRRFADPQDDSIFHPRTWHRAARLEVRQDHRQLSRLGSKQGCARRATVGGRRGVKGRIVDPIRASLLTFKMTPS